jgi:hypothetical protein
VLSLDFKASGELEDEEITEDLGFGEDGLIVVNVLNFRSCF